MKLEVRIPKLFFILLDNNINISGKLAGEYAEVGK